MCLPATFKRVSSSFVILQFGLSNFTRLGKKGKEREGSEERDDRRECELRRKLFLINKHGQWLNYCNCSLTKDGNAAL